MDQDLKTELSKHGIFATTFEELYNWGRKNSVWPLTFGLAQMRMWTRGGMFSTTGGVSYLFNPQTAFTVDVSYTPLGVNRMQGAGLTNDGLFNVRALLSYHFSFRNRNAKRPPLQ